MTPAILELVGEGLHLLVDLLKSGNEREALRRIKDFRQQVQADRDEIDAELKKKHGVSE